MKKTEQESSKKFEENHVSILSWKLKSRLHIMREQPINATDNKT